MDINNKSAADIYKDLDSLIAGTSSLTDNEREKLALENIFALIANCEII